MRLRRPKLSVWITLVVSSVLFVLSGCAIDPVALQKRLEPHYRTVRPDGRGPFPAVMFVSGCGGFATTVAPAHYVRTAERLKGEGYVVIFVDYLSARRLQSACRGEVRFDEIGQDILASASYLRSLAFVKGSEISVIGWSWGGGGVLASLSEIRADQPAPFRVAVVYYPVCRDIPAWKTKIPVLMLLGALDDVTPPQLCEDLVKRVPKGHPVEVRLYPEARHAFDASEVPPIRDMPGLPGRTLGYNPKAAAAAWEEVQAFLKR